MGIDDDRCDEARRLQRLDEAFRTGDLDALRAALDDPGVVPNGAMPGAIGSCLVYAIYHSPLPFVRTLLELGADPNGPADDGFPPLIAALGTHQRAPGATGRLDVDDVLRLLLDHGADPDQRGTNDYTPLHMAVAVRHPLAIQILLDAGADPRLRTRIDDQMTPLEMAEAAGVSAAVAILSRNGRPLDVRLRAGLTLQLDLAGTGDLVRRQHDYRIRLRMWLQGGEPVRLTGASELAGRARLDDDRGALVTEVRINRGRIISGLFYGLDGMRIGGTRRIAIAAHLAYGERGVPGTIPPHAGLTAEVTVLEEVATGSR